jgi:hypothetical protein
MATPRFTHVDDQVLREAMKIDMAARSSPRTIKPPYIALGSSWTSLAPISIVTLATVKTSLASSAILWPTP